jgi:hypothetical protein
MAAVHEHRRAGEAIADQTAVAAAFEGFGSHRASMIHSSFPRKRESIVVGRKKAKVKMD